MPRSRWAGAAGEPGAPGALLQVRVGLISNAFQVSNVSKGSRIDIVGRSNDRGGLFDAPRSVAMRRSLAKGSGEFLKENL